MATKDMGYELSFVKILFGKDDSENEKHPITYVKGKCLKKENLNLNLSELQPGTYFAFVEIDWWD